MNRADIVAPPISPPHFSMKLNSTVRVSVTLALSVQMNFSIDNIAICCGFFDQWQAATAIQRLVVKNFQ